MNRRLLLIFVLIFSLLPSFYLSYLHLIDSFLFSPLQEISAAYSNGRLDAVSPDQPAYVMILYMISSVCNIAPLQLAYLPIGALILPFCIYALSRKIMESKTIPILLLLYFSFDFSINQGQYSVFASSWAHPLFFIFVLLYILYATADKRNPVHIVLILITFTCIVFLHPTYVFWAISFAIALNLIIAISKTARMPNVKLIATPYLTVSLFVIYFGFNQLYFGFYIHRVILLEPEIISEQFISVVRSFLGFSAPLTAPYQISLGAPTSVIGYAAFARTSILVVCITLGLVAWISKNFHEFSKKFDNMLVLMIALLIAGMMHTIGYAFYGHISMRFMIILFPIIAALLLRKAGIKRIKNVMIALIIILAFAQTASFVSSDYGVNDIDTEMTPSSDWLISHTQGEAILLSDFTTSQMIKYYFNSVEREMTQRFYTSDVYSLIVTGEEPITITEFVAVNWELDVTSSVGWATYEPLSHYQVGISENTHLNRIFDDGRITIFRSTSFA